MFNLDHLNLKDLNHFVDDPITHISVFAGTFEDAIAAAGPDSFIPMVTYFSNPSTLEMTIEAIPYSDKDDMYKIMNEMLHFYSASKSHSFIFAFDIRKTTYNQNNPDSKTATPTDALSLSFVSEESSGIFTMPYQIVDNKVDWVVSEFELSNMVEDDPTKKYQGDMVELYYLMTHLEGPLFTVPQLLNYYSYRGYNFMIPDTTRFNAIKVIKNES